MSQYRALIIGCGNIGGFYDLATDKILTYAKAFYLDSEIDFEVFDTTYEKVEKISKTYGIKIVKEINENELSKFDIVVISSPTETHFKYLSLCMDIEIPVVICEKPVANNIAEIELLEKMFLKSKSNIIVNYFRNFQPKNYGIKSKLKEISSKESCQTITVEYQRGIHNNASHAIKFLEYLFDSKAIFSNALVIRKSYDEFHSDPTSTVASQLGVAKLYLIGLPNVKFSILNINIFFEKTVIRIFDAGDTVEFYNVETLDQQEHYQHLLLTTRIENINYHPMLNVSTL
jgi:predicted dehydrogenase